MFLLILGLQPYIHKGFDSCFFLFLIGLVDDIMFSFLDSFPVYSEHNIVDHISAKHILTRYCLQCFVIRASKFFVTMQLIEGSNQMDYLLILLDFDDYFPSQMI
jgi:hypothetical protein